MSDFGVGVDTVRDISNHIKSPTKEDPDNLFNTTTSAKRENVSKVQMNCKYMTELFAQCSSVSFRKDETTSMEGIEIDGRISVEVTLMGICPMT